MITQELYTEVIYRFKVEYTCSFSPSHYEKLLAIDTYKHILFIPPKSVSKPCAIGEFVYKCEEKLKIENRITGNKN